MNVRVQVDPEVLVVGAGPAGSVTALLLARLGRRVLLLDRSYFPRPKPCGECVNPGAVRLLGEAGILSAVLDLEPALLHGWRITSEEGHVAQGTFDSEGPTGLGISRADLDHALLRAALREGVRFAGGLRAVDACPHPNHPRVTVVDGEHGRRDMEAQIVVAADGLRSVVARRAGLVRKPRDPRKASVTFRVRGTGPSRRRGFLWVGPGRTLGLAPVAARDPLWNLTVVVESPCFGRELASGPWGLAVELLQRSGLRWESGPILLEGPWASGPFHQPSRGSGAPGIVAVGDAAGYFDPLTGQGIYRALFSARLAAPAVHLALECPERSQRILAEYGQNLDRALAPGRRVQRVIEAVMSRGVLRRGALRGLSRTPRALDTLIGFTGDLSPPRALARPDLWARTLAAALG